MAMMPVAVILVRKTQPKYLIIGGFLMTRAVDAVFGAFQHAGVVPGGGLGEDIPGGGAGVFVCADQHAGVFGIASGKVEQ